MNAVPIVPFLAADFARELLLRKLEAEVCAERLRPHWLDSAREILSAPAALAQIFNQPVEVRHVRAHA